jgi:glucans biosynthesis protein C
MTNTTDRNIWVDYLRSAITVLVIAHHSSLAYTTFAKFDETAYINSTHAIVDTQRWIGLDIFENINDIFFMSLMFLIGGLFISKSMQKKGDLTFVKDRIYRLFIPFIFGGTLFMLIASVQPTVSNFYKPLIINAFLNTKHNTLNTPLKYACAKD